MRTINRCDGIQRLADLCPLAAMLQWLWINMFYECICSPSCFHNHLPSSWLWILGWHMFQDQISKLMFHSCWYCVTFKSITISRKRAILLEQPTQLSFIPYHPIKPNQNHPVCRVNLEPGKVKIIDLFSPPRHVQRMPSAKKRLRSQSS